MSRLHRRSFAGDVARAVADTAGLGNAHYSQVTNGVHVPSWLNRQSPADLYDQYLEPDWRHRWTDPGVWSQVEDIPDEELLEVHRRRKRRLIAFIRDRQTASAFRRKAAASELRRSAGGARSARALTIGFARRFATYKRATLLFRDVDRLKKILCNRERPVQVIIAGKAHPKDQPGKSFIREIVQLSRDADLWKHIVFIEDYDMKIARELVQGVDLWLNNPRRGEEACGTSGMKAAMNGVLESVRSPTDGSTRPMKSREAGRLATAKTTRKSRTRFTRATFITCSSRRSYRCITRSRRAGSPPSGSSV